MINKTSMIIETSGNPRGAAGQPTLTYGVATESPRWHSSNGGETLPESGNELVNDSRPRLQMIYKGKFGRLTKNVSTKLSATLALD
jgi:hypothetical protein